MPSPSAAWEFRLRAVFDAPIEDVTEENLNGLVANGVREDVDLDFKQAAYGSGDSAKRELAGDIAAMANERGGVIIIGIRDEEDVAAELTPVEIADGDEARFRMIVAGNAAPNVAFGVHVVVAEKEEKMGYYLLAIPPSSLRPHAVRKNNDLRYPRRNGTTTRWLSESEVADMYRDRFRLSTDQTARAEAVLSEGLDQLDLEDDAAYMALALVPTVEGSMSISQARIREVEEWSVDPEGSYCWRGFFGRRPQARPGLRRIALAYGLDNHERPGMPYAELHSDGAGFACERLSRPPSNGMGPEDPKRIPFLNVHMLWETARSLRLLGRHAVENTGAWGDAIVIARLLGKDMTLTYLMDGRFEQAVTERGFDGPIDSRHTLLLESIAGADQELLASTRVVAGDLFNALGAAEIIQIDSEGRIRSQYVKRDSRFLSFVEACGVEISDERVPRG